MDMPQLTINPVADAEAFEDATEQRASLLDMARDAWTEYATPECIEDVCDREEFLALYAIFLDFANARSHDADMRDRALMLLRQLSVKALPVVPKQPLERLKFLDDYVEQLR